MALLLAALIISPPGRISEGHINPAISLAMWRFGVFPGAAVTPYAVAQLVGSLLGVLAVRALWGPVTGRPPVTHAALQPATGWTAAELFVVEAVSMGTGCAEPAPTAPPSPPRTRRTLGRSRVRTGPAGSERTSPCPAGAAAPACPGTDEGPAPAGVPGQVRKP
ncbi:aquaporin [Streptomyces nodosus]|uniref:aquaporin n=1 Tax=Streptomyces nodosus TaxID=40318 RepID=UPI0038081EA4